MTTVATIIRVSGYDKPYRITKKPVYGRDVHIAEDFISQRRLEFTPENERQAVPECLIWRDRIDKWWDDGISRDTGTPVLQVFDNF